MAIDGESIKAADFWDDDTKQIVSVNLKVKEIIMFRLLQKIEAALRR